jgi:hypothetical protein
MKDRRTPWPAELLQWIDQHLDSSQSAVPQEVAQEAIRTPMAAAQKERLVMQMAEKLFLERTVERQEAVAAQLPAPEAEATGGTFVCSRCGYERQVESITDEHGNPVSAEAYMAAMETAGMELLCDDCAPDADVTELGAERSRRR